MPATSSPTLAAPAIGTATRAAFIVRTHNQPFASIAWMFRYILRLRD